MSKKVWVLGYSHRHGTDISVYSTANKAKLAALDSIGLWFDELEDQFGVSRTIVKKIRKAYIEDNYNKASELWNKHTEETFFIEAKTVH
jgi:hypothetical protein